MRKFAIQTKKGKTVIMELEVEVIQPVEDPSVMWLNPGEYRARVLKPESTFQKVKRKDENGKEIFVMIPDVWCWHALYEDQPQALEAAGKLVEQEFEFNKRKYNKEYTEADLATAIQAIEVVML